MSSKNELFLEDIKAFNNFFYKNCYYNCLLTVCNYIGISDWKVIVNDIYSDSIFRLKYGYSEHDLYSLLLAIGVIANAYSKNEIVEYMLTILNNKNVVILFVDLFYIPYRTDVYQKENSVHAVVVCGYNLEKQVFYILDQKNFFSMDFAIREVSFENVSKSSSSLKKLRDNYKKMDLSYVCDTIGICSSYKKDNMEKINIDIKHEIIRQVKDNTGKLLYECDCFANKITAMKKTDNEIKEIVRVINSLLIRKKAEIYLLKECCCYNSESINNCQEILKKIQILKNCVLKKNVDSNKVVLYAETIVNQERKWFINIEENLMM